MRKNRNSIPPEAILDLISAYQSDVSAFELAQRYDVTPPTVSRSLRKHGIHLRTRGELNSLRAPIDVDELVRLVDAAELPLWQIADRLRVSKPTVERTLRRLGMKSKRGHGSPMEKNYFWKGGRNIDGDGYVLVKCPEHPYATKSGYVREHRLVMEKKLGRYLTREEVVHHEKRNDRQNNDPDSLQVFPTNADHLRHELTGKTPNYTPEGLQRMRENALRVNARRAANRKASKSDGDR